MQPLAPGARLYLRVGAERLCEGCAKAVRKVRASVRVSGMSENAATSSGDWPVECILEPAGQCAGIFQDAEDETVGARDEIGKGGDRRRAGMFKVGRKHRKRGDAVKDRDEDPMRGDIGEATKQGGVGGGAAGAAGEGEDVHAHRSRQRPVWVKIIWESRHKKRKKPALRRAFNVFVLRMWPEEGL